MHGLWTIYHLDVKSAFLYGEVQEGVYVDQPPGFMKKGYEFKVYRLKEALSRLTQIPRTWYACIDSHRAIFGFKKSSYEHTLYMKRDYSVIIIVWLYEDDLIYTGDNPQMLEEFKHQ